MNLALEFLDVCVDFGKARRAAPLPRSSTARTHAVSSEGIGVGGPKVANYKYNA